MTGSDQRLARQKNMEMIFSLLKDQDLSSSEMATQMGLSKTALTKIMKEMLDANYVFYNEKDIIEERRGRRKQYFTLNPNMGMFLFINFIYQHIEVILYDLTGREIKRLTKPTQGISEDLILPNLITKLIELVHSYQTDTNILMSILIAAPGKVDKKKNVFKQSNMYKALESFELAQTLHEQLNVPVYLKNDINLALHGYMKKREEKQSNTLMIYMGDSVGGAVYTNGSILEGDHGYAAEFGLMNTFDEKGNLTTIESLCSMKTLYRKLNVSEVSQLIGLAERYDLTLSSALDKLSQHLAQLMHNFYQIFDFEHMCIAGDIEVIRDFFLPKLDNKLGLYDLENREIKIDFERDIESLMILGAKDLLQSQAFQTLIDKRKDKMVHYDNI